MASASIVFARIVTVAEQFDRLQNPMNGENMQSFPVVYAMRAILHPAMLTRFNPQVIRALLAVLPPYPPGSIVRLSDDRWAVCIEHNRVDPCRPKVQLIPDPNDLAADNVPPGDQVDLSFFSPKILAIAHCDGQDVSEFNFKNPDLHRDGYEDVALV